MREKVAAFIGAEADEIAFVPNTSTGINLIVDLLGDEGAVLSDELEFPTVTLPWIHRGIQVHFMPAVEGILRLESFRAGQAPRAATICISHVQFSNGCRQDLEAFGASRATGGSSCAAASPLGAFPVDVKQSGIDAFVTSGHKWLCAGYGGGLRLRAPRAARRGQAPAQVGLDERGAALRLRQPAGSTSRRASRASEMGCPPFAPIFALGAALDYLTGLGKAAIAERVLALNMYLTSRLQRRDFEVLSPGATIARGRPWWRCPSPRRPATSWPSAACS